MAEVAEFRAALTTVEEAYRAGLRAFAKWLAANWTMTRKEWRGSFEEPPPSDDWFAGYQAGLEAADAALDVFLDEIHR